MRVNNLYVDRMNQRVKDMTWLQKKIDENASR